MANNACRRWCGLTLVVSLVMGLVVLLGIYLVVRKLTCKSGSGASTLSMATDAKEVDEATVKKMAKAATDKPLIVMIFAHWCGYCKAMKPDFLSLAKSSGDRATFALLDGDKAKQLCKDNDIGGFPVLLKYKGGKMMDKQVGKQPKEGIQRFIDS